MITPAVKQQLRVKFNNKCVKCGSTEDLSIDHIVPKWLGGSDNIENLQIMCRTCNWKKGHTPPLWYRLKHLFTNFWYNQYIKLEAKLFSFNENNQAGLQSLKDQFKNLEAKVNGKQVDSGIMPKLNLLEFEIKMLKTENLQLKEKLKGIEEYEKIHWVENIIEIKEYQKND